MDGGWSVDLSASFLFTYVLPDTFTPNAADYTVNPQRMAYGWTSNNSVFATLGMDYGPICERVRKNGEPGFAWLSNMQVCTGLRCRGWGLSIHLFSFSPRFPAAITITTKQQQQNRSTAA